jgi:hypothetical protein
MAVVSSRELGRSFSHRFGESPTAQIRVAFDLDGATPTQTIISSGGYSHGTAHPEYGYMLCVDGQVTESSAYKAEAVYSFATPAEGTGGFVASPLSRPDVWSFSTSGLSVPTFRFYNGNGNGDIKPLANTAGDIIEGAQAIEGELRATVSGNRATFPLATAIAVTGCVNSDSYAGASPHRWLCNGISAQKTTEVVNGQQVTYWQVSAELSYKPSGYNLYLPNAGWNYLDGGTKKRATVKYRDEAGVETDVASANVVALTQGGGLQTSGDVIILERRVNPAVAFATYFGTPPTS